MDNRTRTSRLSAMERQRQMLDDRIQALRKKELLALPAQFGLESIDELVIALLEHASDSLRERLKAEGVDRTDSAAAGIPRIKFSPEL